MVGSVRDKDRVFEFFAGQGRHRAALAQGGNERVGAGSIQHLYDLTLHVDLAGFAEHAGQTGAAGQTAHPLGAGSDRADNR